MAADGLRRRAGLAVAVFCFLLSVPPEAVDGGAGGQVYNWGLKQQGFIAFSIMWFLTLAQVAKPEALSPEPQTLSPKPLSSMWWLNPKP